MVACMAQAAEIHVMSSMSIKEAYLELVPRFEKESGHKVVTSWVGSSDIMKRMRAGEATDLVIMAANAIDELAKEGSIAPGSRVDLVKSGIGVAVRAGAPKPDISSGEALKRALLAAKSIGYSSGPSGVYLARVLKGWGIPESRLLQTPPGAPVGEVLARGEVEIGFQQVSELLPVKGIDYVGPLPADLQLVTVFSAGTHSASKESAAAKELTRFLTSPVAVPVMKQKGLDPA
jgi:molybdate transport system substrate-binding protein